MKTRIVSLAAALLLLAPGLVRAQRADPTGAGSAEGGPARPERREMEEDVEILRRLLNRSLSDSLVQAADANRKLYAFSPDRKQLATRDGNTYKLWEVSTGRLIRQFPLKAAHAPGFAPAEGVYLKGQGVVYTVTLPPVALYLKTVSAKPSPKPLSDWERTRREVRGTPAEAEAPPAPTPVSLADAILRLLSRNGHHFKHLAPGERLTVVVTFREPGDGAERALAVASAGHPQPGTSMTVTSAGGLTGNVVPAAATSAGQPQPLFRGSSGAPSSARDYELMGDLHVKQGQAQDAVHAYKRALQLAPGSPSAEAARLNRKLGMTYLMYAERSSPPNREEVVRHAITLLQRAGEQGGETKLAPAPLPGRLVVSARKGLLDQVGAGKMTFSDLRQAALIEFQPAITAGKAPSAKGR